MARVKFSDVFHERPDGRLECTRRTCIAGTTLSSGTSFTKGSSFSGIAVAEYQDLDLEIKNKSKSISVRGAYSSTGLIRFPTPPLTKLARSLRRLQPSARADARMKHE